MTPARGVQIERSLPGAGNFKPLYGRLEVPGDLQGVDLCHCHANLARAQFRATTSVMGTTIRHAHLPERRACSCKGPKKPHRNLVGLRRTASRSPRSVLSARAPPPLSHHSDRRMQERLHGLNQPPAGADRPGAAMSGTVRRVVPFSSEADRSNGGTLASPLSRPSRARRP